MRSHYRYATPYYEVVVLTAPARIESIAVDPSGRGRYLGVINNFGRLGSTVFASYGSFGDVESKAVVAGRPSRVDDEPGRLRLAGLPVGPHGLVADWMFEFAERTFDVVLDWTVESPQVDLWEAGWQLDAVARSAGDAGGWRSDSGELGRYGRTSSYLAWSEDDPRYAHTLVAAVVPGSVDRGDLVRVERPSDRPVTSGQWCTVAVEGGAELPAGRFRAGRWRIGASGRAADRSYARAVAGEAGGGSTATPHPGTEPSPSQRAAAAAWAHRLDRSGIEGGAVQRGPDGAWLLSDGQILAAFVPQDDVWACWLYVSSGERWQLAATAAPTLRVDAVEPGANDVRVHGVLLGLDGRAEVTTEQLWRLPADGRHGDGADASGSFTVRAVDTPVDGHRAHPMHSFLAYPGERNKHEIGRYDVLAGPGLRPQADLVMGQRALWSPAVQVQHGSASVALIPDLLEHRQTGAHGAMPTDRYFGPALDLDVANRLVDAPALSFGWRAVEGVFGYYFRDCAETPADPVVVAYDLVLRAGAADRSVTSDVQRRLWTRVGRRYLRSSCLPQTQGADAAFDEAWSYWRRHYDSRQIDARTVGAVRVDRELDGSVNFISWFNALRTSYGLYTYGRDRGDDDLVVKGRSTLDLLLAAPQERGAFPTIAWFREGGVEWQASQRNFLHQMPWGPRSYSTFDMGWAAYWVLRWYQDLVDEPRALAFAREYGEFVVGQQLASGAVPSWFSVGTLDVDPHLRESAQTASSVMFLAELAKVTGEPRYRMAAERAGRYVVEHHLDRQRWDDFEPYYSNTLKSEGAADPFSGQFTQNTLSMHFAAIGLLTLAELTDDAAWLSAGERTVDTFLQYQYVTPGLGLSLNSFGGFAVQNTDNEALDARQSQFGVTLLDYARATGRADYAERGIAALRAGFATMSSPSAEVISPRYFDAHPTGRGPENYAHATFDVPAEYTVFDWGQGSAAAGFAEARNRFGDVWVDAGRGVAFGIDNVRVERCRVHGSELDLELSSPSSGHTVLLKVDRPDVRGLTVRVNGSVLRRAAASELESGLRVPTRQEVRIVHNPVRAGPLVPGEPFEVRARITHELPVEEALVHYRVGAGPWLLVPMERVGGDEWLAAVPAAAAGSGRALAYYLSARTSRETRTAPETDPDQVPFVRPLPIR